MQELRCRLNAYRQKFILYPAQVFSSEICGIFKNTFENTNNFVEHLQRCSCKVLFSNCYFVIITYHNNLRDFGQTGDDFFTAVRFIPY